MLKSYIEILLKLNTKKKIVLKYIIDLRLTIFTIDGAVDRQNKYSISSRQ